MDHERRDHFHFRGVHDMYAIAKAGCSEVSLQICTD